MPKNPASNSDWCQPAWASQYSSDVDDAGSFGLLSTSQERSRARNAASSGESPKSICSSDPPPVEHAGEVRAGAAKEVAGEQRSPEVHVRHALPGVADAAVHLDRRLADGPCGPGAVRLGDRRRIERIR